MLINNDGFLFPSLVFNKLIFCPDFIPQLWNNSHHPDDVEAACQESLDLLGLSYLDLYLMHWPMAYKVGKRTGCF